MKRLVLFVEGEGDATAVPVLVSRLITERNGWDSVTLDQEPFRVQNLQKLAKDDCRNWTRWLQAASLRGNLGGVLLILDGDIEKFAGEPFCPFRVAQHLVRKAQSVRAGEAFSVAVVFACQEYESWLIAGVESLAGRLFPDGRSGILAGTVPPQGDLEQAPRDAKGWLGKFMASGYSEAKDQESLTRLIDLDVIRKRQLRSFRRMDSAVTQLLDAVRTGQHVSTPIPEGSVP